MKGKLKVSRYRQTCEGCPSQWDIFTEEGQYIYARYRWGRLTLALNGYDNIILNLSVGDGLDGIMETEELMRLTKNILEW